MLPLQNHTFRVKDYSTFSHFPLKNLLKIFKETESSQKGGVASLGYKFQSHITAFMTRKISQQLTGGCFYYGTWYAVWYAITKQRNSVAHKEVNRKHAPHPISPNSTHTYILKNH